MRILIVSPHFPPTNAPDLHRVRLLLPYFSKFGVEATVLAVTPEATGFPEDHWLLGGIPRQIKVHRVKALSVLWRKVPGLGSLAIRSYRSLARTGDDLLDSDTFDLIYFSTTVFPLHKLGLRWKRKFGTPFVIDYQDPWVTDYYREHPNIIPPGGRIKYALVDFLHRRMEPKVLRECAGITAVSPSYPKQLAIRYPWVAATPCLIQPFPGDSVDMSRVIAARLPQTIFSNNPTTLNWVYAGVIIPGMAQSLKAFFQSLRDSVSKEFLERLTLHFIGTQYSDKSNEGSIIMEIANSFGLGRIVKEHVHRIPYSEVLACLRDADALMVFGSDDPTYTASKIYPYLLSGRPLIVVFHEESSVIQLMEKVSGGVCISFASGDATSIIADKITRRWFSSAQFNQVVPLDSEAFIPNTASESTNRLSAFFRQCLSHVNKSHSDLPQSETPRKAH